MGDRETNVPEDSKGGPGIGSQRIVIRLSTTEPIDSDDLRELAKDCDFNELLAFLEDNPPRSAERVIQSVTPTQLRELEKELQASESPPRHSLTAYWRLDFSGQGDISPLLQRLKSMLEIGLAYEESLVETPCPALTGNPMEICQAYLNAAATGIDAHWAWQQPHGEGQGIDVIDLEAGWILNHQDLPAPQLLYNDNSNSGTRRDHGAAVLGVIGATDNNLGVIGIAPRLKSLRVVSHYNACTNTNYHVADAIIAAMQYLDAGSVLLLEVHRRAANNKHYPTEIDSADLQAICLASASGIIVVEAAGNGFTDLGDWQDPANQHSMNPNSSLFVDSGAIVVGASRSAVNEDPPGHERLSTSNYGARVDCYAWGQDIVTAGYGKQLGQNVCGQPAGLQGAVDSYTDSFAGTSGASAIIAGAAALVQGWCLWRCAYPLTSRQMRAVLAKPSTGTPQAGITGQPIGVMPNLRAILTWRLRLRLLFWCLRRRLSRFNLRFGWGR